MSKLQELRALALGLTLSSSMSLSAYAHNSAEDLISPRTIFATVQLDNYALGMWKLQGLNIDIAGVDLNTKQVGVVLSEGEYARLTQLGFKVESPIHKNLLRGPDPEYKNPAEIEEFVQRMHNEYPNLTMIKKIGESAKKRPIWAIKITKNKGGDPAVHETGKPAVLFNGMHHAREVMTPEIVMDLIEQLLTKTDVDPAITAIVENNEIWAVPMLNVDGNQIVWDSNNMWRKNANYGYGVDLNRNYPFNWNKCNGSSGNRNSETYRGPSAGSEPETQTLMKLVREIRPVFDISYHSYSELVLYPVGCPGERVSNREVVEGLGKEIGRKLGYRAGTTPELLYAADGGDIDWMYGEYQVIPYVIEVSPQSDGFQPRYNTTRQRTVEKNRGGWRILLDRMARSGIHGVIAGAADKVLKVEQQLGGQWKSYQNYKINPDGGFHLILVNGVYRLTQGTWSQVVKVDKRVDLGTVNVPR